MTEQDQTTDQAPDDRDTGETSSPDDRTRHESDLGLTDIKGRDPWARIRADENG